MGRIRNTLAMAAVGAALTASSASGAEAPPPSPSAPAGPPQQPASTTKVPAPVTPGVQQGATLVAPPAPAEPTKPQHTGGTPSGGSGKESAEPKPSPSTSEPAPGATAVPTPSQAFAVPSVPTSSCAAAGVPPILVPIYQRAAAAYGLGPQGASVLAGINEVETAFGTNLNVSSAGAVGWMQFMPSTWETYGVDANGDGVSDPYNPEDAIFAAARYLSAAGMPADTYGAIYAYNHADWYVAEVLANANCYAPTLGGAAGALVTTPELQVLSCRPGPGWHRTIPPEYLDAFEAAAARYDLGQRGVWALAAVARLESNFGRGLSKRQLRQTGALGLEPSEWHRYAVDGDEDGRIRHADPADSAATLARLIWSRGSIRAGVFTHNQAAWYVQAVLRDGGDRRDRRRQGAADRRAGLARRRRGSLPAAGRAAEGRVDLRLRGGRRHRAARADGQSRAADRHVQARRLDRDRLRRRRRHAPQPRRILRGQGHRVGARDVLAAPGARGLTVDTPAAPRVT